MDYILYCDESAAEGRFFSNFYGGALIRGRDFDRVDADLNQKKKELNFMGEIKWQKVTENYLQKYIDMMDVFFDYVKRDIIKVRIMFTQNCRVPVKLTREQMENSYFKLYYQFIKHGFGFRYSNNDEEDIYLRLYFDTLPDTKEKCRAFKEYILRLQNTDQFKEGRIIIRKDDIAEVISHKHVILQCMDIVLGAMYFRLNNLHLEKPDGSKKRGKRTIAKDKLYRHIYKHIREIYPGFNIGASTGTAGRLENRWAHPYRHWLFMPAEYEIDLTRAKSHQEQK